MSDNKFILAVAGVAALAGGTLYANVSDNHSIEWWACLVAAAWAILGALIIIVFLSAKDVISERITEWEAWKPQIQGSMRPPRPSSRKTQVAAGTLILLCAAIGGLVIYAGPRKAVTSAPPPFNPVTPTQPPRQTDAPPPQPPGPKQITQPPATKLHATSSPDSGSSIEGLTKLGWTVVATGDTPTIINFQQARNPLPDMVKSARYMRELKGKLDVGIIEASSLSGLSQLSTLGNIDGLRLAGNFPDLSELRSFKQLQRLDLIGGSTLNLGPVGSLIQLRELVLQQPHDKSPDFGPLSALVNLQKFLVYGFALTDIPALHEMRSLKYLDLTDTPLVDLSVLRNLPAFNELIIDQRSMPALRELTGSAVKVLRVRHHDGIREPINLGPVTLLQNLKTLDITAAASLTLAPVASIAGLSELTIMGTAVSLESFRDVTVHLVDPASIGELHGLKKLGLSWVDIGNTSFMAGLGSLEEVYVNQTRSLSDIRTLGTLRTLRSVQLVATNVVDISPLLNLRLLKTLIVQVTPARLDVITELQNRGVVVK